MTTPKPPRRRAAITDKAVEAVAKAIHRESEPTGACGNACDHEAEARAAIRAYRRATRPKGGKKR